MIRLFFIALALTLALPAVGQNLVLKDGKTIAAKSLRRQGDVIMVTIQTGTEKTQTGEVGYSMDQVDRLDYPEPPQLRTAPELIAQGKASDALAQIDPVVSFYAVFRDMPGSWWPDASLVKAQALASLGREREVDALASLLASSAANPETRHGANVFLAANRERRGDFTRAKELVTAALKECKRPSTRALASIVLGQCLLNEKQWDDAVLAFLEVPVFYPGEKPLLPQALLGAGRALSGIEDLSGAKAKFDELLNLYPEAPEAVLAKTELAQIARREKALAEPK